MVKIKYGVFQLALLLTIVIYGASSRYTKRFLKKFCGDTCTEILIIKQVNDAAMSGDCSSNTGIVAVAGRGNSGDLCIAGDNGCQLRPGDSIQIGFKLADPKPYHVDLCLMFNYEHAPGVETTVTYPRPLQTTISGRGNFYGIEGGVVAQPEDSMILTIENIYDGDCYLRISNLTMSLGPCGHN